jgi:hypothetical protein
MIRGAAVTSIVLVAGLVALLGGCATSPAGAERAQAPQSLSGTWSGTLSGPDMATAAGVLESPARLTIGDDGRWTLTSSGGAVARGTSRRVADTLLLDGEGQTFFLGHRIDAGMSLGRVS